MKQRVFSSRNGSELKKSNIRMNAWIRFGILFFAAFLIHIRINIASIKKFVQQNQVRSDEMELLFVDMKLCAETNC
jgi:hypothetical protein